MRTRRISGSMRMGGQEGFALPTALAFVVITGILVGTTLLVGSTQQRLSSDFMRTTQAQYAAEAGIERASEEVFVKMMQKIALPENRVLREYRRVLSTQDIAGATGQSIQGFVGGTSTTTTTGKRLDADGKIVLISGQTVDGDNYSVQVKRVDVRNSQTILEVTSTGIHRDLAQKALAKDATTRIIKRRLVISPRFAGLDYALLSNNINCSLCHTKIMDMETQYKSNGTATLAQLSGAPMVRVASLREVDMRVSYKSGFPDAPDTLIGGTFYTRGGFKDQNLAAISGAQLDSEGQLQFFSRSTDPALRNTLTGANPISSSTQDCNVACAAPGTVYLNYPFSGGVDGDLVTEFPLPIFDKNSNRVVDNDEWSAAISDSFYDQGKMGTITGGTKNFYALSGDWNLVSSTTTTKTYVDEDGVTKNKVINRYAAAFSPTSITLTDANFNNYDTAQPPSATSYLTTTHGVRGSLILSGTSANPLKIQNSVYVDGDVVIWGKVQGDGKIFARGNIYVVGDLEYACGTAPATSTCDYSQASTQEDFPRLVLAAGGNILVGDYLSRRGATNADLLDANSVEPSNRPMFENANKTWLQAYGPEAPATINGVAQAYRPIVHNNGSLTKVPFPTVANNSIKAPMHYVVCAQQATSGTATTCSWPGGGSRTVQYGANGSYKSMTFNFGTAASPTNLTCNAAAFGNPTISPNPATTSRYCYVPADPVQASFVADELANFNRGEELFAAQASNVATYLPRYYIFRTGDYPIRPTSDTTELFNNYSTNEIRQVNSPGSAVISSLSPTGNWISEQALKQLWINNMETPTRQNMSDPWDAQRSKPIQIDGILYSSNAIFAISRGNTNVDTGQYVTGTKKPKRSTSGGRITVNGAVVSPDMGLFASGDASDGISKTGSASNKLRWAAGKNKDAWVGLHINYDRRASDALPLSGSGLISELGRVDNSLSGQE